MQIYARASPAVVHKTLKDTGAEYVLVSRQSCYGTEGACAIRAMSLSGMPPEGPSAARYWVASVSLGEATVVFCAGAPPGCTHREIAETNVGGSDKLETLCSRMSPLQGVPEKSLAKHFLQVAHYDPWVLFKVI